MIYKWLTGTLISLFFSLTLYSQSGSKGTLEIRFTELRSGSGKIAIGINTSEEGWPRKPQIELNWNKENVKEGVFTVKVPDLSYGTLAISALDDENGDLEMHMTLGIPREGFGFSKDSPVGLSAPKFEDCSFRFYQPNQHISIRMRYMGKGK
ncbi:MAG: DUF2141 domain-containing protein [Bacteroidales bacterium]|nr:DUF2141 domain-containing protein [Bacteroidales bacterium]